MYTVIQILYIKYGKVKTLKLKEFVPKFVLFFFRFLKNLLFEIYLYKYVKRIHMCMCKHTYINILRMYFKSILFDNCLEISMFSS